MNIQHLKYAVEVARVGSINKAAETLYMNQPNLSRAIRELETSLGISIFDRSSKGMVVTPDGEVFLGYAQNLLRQIDEIKAIYQKKAPVKQKFSLSAPGACYITDAFARFSQTLTEEPAEVFYRESASQQTIHSVQQGDSRLGILRYPLQYDAHFRRILEENSLTWELIADFQCSLLMSERHPLAKAPSVSLDDLADSIEVIHVDPYLANLPAEARREEKNAESRRRIFVYEKYSRFDILSHNTAAFMWSTPTPQAQLSAYHLVQKPCADAARACKDVLIYHRDYKLTELDQRFIAQLCHSRQQYMK